MILKIGFVNEIKKKKKKRIEIHGKNIMKFESHMS